MCETLALRPNVKQIRRLQMLHYFLVNLKEPLTEKNTNVESASIKEEGTLPKEEIVLHVIDDDEPNMEKEEEEDEHEYTLFQNGGQ